MADVIEQAINRAFYMGAQARADQVSRNKNPLKSDRLRTEWWAGWDKKDHDLLEMQGLANPTKRRSIPRDRVT